MGGGGDRPCFGRDADPIPKLLSRLGGRLHVSFFPVVKPGLSVFFFIITVLVSFVAYLLTKPEKVNEYISASVDHFDTIPFLSGENSILGKDGMPDIASLVSKGVEAAQEQMFTGSFLDPLIEAIVAQKIQIECKNDPKCIKNADHDKVFTQIKDEISKQMKESLSGSSKAIQDAVAGSEKNSPNDTQNSQMKEEMKKMISAQVEKIQEKFPLNLLVALLVFLSILPFVPVFAWAAAGISYLFFLILRGLRVIQVTEETVKRKVYV